jgi:hypothetical protein
MKKIISTKEIKSETVIRFYKSGFGYGMLIAEHPYEHFFITTTTQETFAYLYEQDSLTIYLWSEHKGSFSWTSHIIGKIYDGENYFIVLKHKNKIKWEEKRECLTATVSIPITFFIFDVQEHEEKHFESSKTTMLHGTLVKLSDSAATLIYQDRLLPLSVLKGHITLFNEKIDILAKIVRITNKANNMYQVQFTGMKKKEKMKILNYVCTTYRE